MTTGETMDQTTLPPVLSTLMQVSARTGVSRSALYREIESGRLKVVRLGRSVRVREQDLAHFVDSLTSQ